MANSPYALRLSHAACWVKCPAFVRMNRTPQAAVIEAQQDNTVREEGTAIHWVAEQIMLHQYVPQVGSFAPNDVEITDELQDAALFYVDVLTRDGYDWHIEEQLHAPSIHPECGGTPDAFSFRSASAPEILLRDLKGGFRNVEVFPNWQLIGYLAAILDAYPGLQFETDAIVDFAIIQPRSYHVDGPVRGHRMLLRDTLPYIYQLSDAAHRTLDGPAVAGPQCDDCAARASCSVAHAAGMRALEIAGEPDVHDLPVAAVDYELLRIDEALRILEARRTGLTAQAQVMLRKGVMLPHFHMEAGNGRLKWEDDAQALAMGQLLGVDIAKPAKPITPTQALKFMPRELIEGMSKRSRGEMKLTRIDGNEAVKAFSKFGV